MRLVATSIVASEVFFLKLKHFILTGIAGGLIALKLQRKSLYFAVQASVGAQTRNRTRDTGIFSPLLYLLSYLSKLVGHLGVEPRTDRL